MLLLRRFAKDNSGATAIEYGLIAALMSLGVIGAMSALGGNLGTHYGWIVSQLTAAIAK